MNSYKNQQKLVKKKKPGWDFNPGPKWLSIVAVSATHHPATVAILFISPYRSDCKVTISTL